MRRILYVIFPIFYVASSLGDNIFTYYYVRVLGTLIEANPFRAYQVYTQPLWTWLIRDFLVLGVAIALTFAYKRLMERDPRTIKLADKAWIILAVVAITRFIPIIHNVLSLYGIDSPLDDVYRIFW